MHELGVTFYILKDVKRVAEANNVKHVDYVTVEIGEVSTVINEQLIDCWNWARKKEECTFNTEMHIENIKAVTLCDDCKKEYETVKYGKTCPYCQSENTYLLCGNEFNIKEIGIYDDT